MAVESRTSTVDLKGDPGPFLARIVSHLDTSYMGGLEVELLKLLLSTSCLSVDEPLSLLRDSGIDHWR